MTASAVDAGAGQQAIQQSLTFYLDASALVKRLSLRTVRPGSRHYALTKTTMLSLSPTSGWLK